MQIIDLFTDSMVRLVKYLNTHLFCSLAIVGIMFLISALISKAGNKKLLILYIAVILYLTLLNRSESHRSVNLRLFWSYRHLFYDKYLRFEILNNILLFAPLGFILSRIYPTWKIIFVPVILSMGIELIQYISARGLLEIDDVISNGLGGLVGWAAGILWIRIRDVLKGHGHLS